MELAKGVVEDVAGLCPAAVGKDDGLAGRVAQSVVEVFIEAGGKPLRFEQRVEVIMFDLTIGIGVVATAVTATQCPSPNVGR